MDSIDWSNQSSPAKAGYKPTETHPWVEGGVKVETANWRKYSKTPVYYTLYDKDNKKFDDPRVVNFLESNHPFPEDEPRRGGNNIWIPPTFSRIDQPELNRKRDLARVAAAEYAKKWPEPGMKHYAVEADCKVFKDEPAPWYQQVPQPNAKIVRTGAFSNSFADGVYRTVRYVCTNPTKRQEFPEHVNYMRDWFWNGWMPHECTKFQDMVRDHNERMGHKCRNFPAHVWEAVRNPFDPDDHYIDGPWEEIRAYGMCLRFWRVPEFGWSADGLRKIPWRIKPADYGFQLQPYSKPVDGWPRTFSIPFTHYAGEDVDNNRVSSEPTYVDRMNGITLRPWEYQSRAKYGYMQSGGDLTPGGFLTPLCGVSWSGADIQKEEAKEARRN